MAREKKFLSPILKDYNKDISKRWRIEYWIKDDNSIHGKRIVVYGNINEGKTVQERYILAAAVMSTITAHLQLPPQLPMLDRVIALHSLEWRKSTCTAYNTVVKVFSKYYPRHEYVTTEDVRTFLLKMKDAGKTGNTLKKYKALLRSLYSRALELGFVTFNPVTVEIKIKTAPRSLLYFSDEQIQKIKLYNNLPPFLWTAIQLQYYCFIRPGEIRALKLSYINFDAGYIEIPGEVSKNKKTEKVSIPLAFFSYLKDRYFNIPKHYYLIGKNGIPGTDQIGANFLNNVHSKILQSLEITGRYAFYSWKHTGVVKAVKAGINIKDLQMQLRHHSLDMVNEYLKNLGVMDSEDLKNRFPEL